MKIVKEIQKQVDYFGISLYVPSWTNYLATDSDGEVWAFSKNPEVEGKNWVLSGVYEAEHVANVDLEGEDWKNTLVEYEAAQ